MLFLFFNNAEIEIAELKKLTWKIYTTAETLPTTSWVELINERKFAKVALDENSETFVVHVAVLKIPIAMPIYFFRTS